MTIETTVEAHAVENGKVVGIYIGPIRRATSWARRANPGAALHIHAAQAGVTRTGGDGEAGFVAKP